MKSILYLMHISWGWIKQRPQFIAEELSENFIVDVLYRKSNHIGKGFNPKFKRDNFNVKGYRELPLERINLIPDNASKFINKVLWHLNFIKWSKYDYIWISDPVIWNIIKPKKLPEKTKLVYDCMDDYSEFPYIKRFPNLKSILEKSEKQLLSNADFIICSAETLADNLKKKYGIDRKISIINNAITDDIFLYSETSDIMLPPKSLVYIGTISEWMDFENLLRLLDKHEDLNIVMFGPMRTSNFPSHKRLIYKGTIPHEKILGAMNQSMGLIMPFLVTPLIEGVNPVKLYEYSYSGKPVIATKYSETLKFADYVDLYSSFSELDSLVAKILEGKSARDMTAMRDFALKNTWKSRVEDINKILNEEAAL